MQKTTRVSMSLCLPCSASLSNLFKVTVVSFLVCSLFSPYSTLIALGETIYPVLSPCAAKDGRMIEAEPITLFYLLATMIGLGIDMGLWSVLLEQF